MANFKAVVLEHHIKPDKTAKLKIRVNHKGKTKYLDTGLTVNIDEIDIPKDDVKKGSRTFGLKKKKAEAFMDKTNETIKSYRDKINEQPLLVDSMNIDQLIEYLTAGENQTKNVNLNFIQFGRAHATRLIDMDRKRTALDYITAINTLLRYLRSKGYYKPELNVNDITTKFLNDFSEWVIRNPANPKNKTKMRRAPSHYLSSIRALHNEMKRQYNDEDRGVMPIPYSPFVRFKMPARPATRKRAISPEDILKIANLPEIAVTNSKGTNRYNLAKDCFILSFCFIGMNSADLFDCNTLSDTHLTYRRKKTRTRRADGAEISVEIQPEVKNLIDKYRDPSGQRVFCFYKDYANESNFNKAINKGLKQIGAKIGIDDLEYYAARHSWATIAVNECGIDKYTVHEALNHVDDSMKITDIYIKKSFERINEANRAVLAYVFKQ